MTINKYNYSASSQTNKTLESINNNNTQIYFTSAMPHTALQDGT